MPFRALFTTWSLLGILTQVAASESATAQSASPPSAMTRVEAIARALGNSPSLDASFSEVRAARGRAMQAGVRPNPQLGLEVEDLTVGAGGPSGTQLTLRAQHAVELGRKRAARTAVAEAELHLASRRSGTDSARVRVEVSTRYALLQAARARVEVAQQSFAIAEELASNVDRRIEAGAISPAEGARARLEVASSRSELTQAISEADIAARSLASTWGADNADGLEIEPMGEVLPALLSRDDLKRRALETAGVLVLESEIRVAERRVAEQRSLSIPDLDVGGGLRSNRATGESSIVLSLTAPLPLFDRNAGNIAAARAELAAAKSRLSGYVRDQFSSLSQSLAEAESARSRLETLRSEITPAADRALQATLDGYQRGRFNYLDVLEARRSRLSAAHAEIQTFLAYSGAVAQLAGTLGLDVGASTFDSKE